MSQRNFLVSIKDDGDNSYSVSIGDKFSHAVTFKPKPDSQLILDINRLRQTEPSRRFLDISTAEEAQARVGNELFNTFFGVNPDCCALIRDFFGRKAPPHRRYEQSMGAIKRFILRLDRTLLWLPWELLRDPDSGVFYSLDYSLIRIDDRSLPNGDYSESRFTLRDINRIAPLRILYVFPNPKGKKHIYGDFEPEKRKKRIEFLPAPSVFKKFKDHRTKNAQAFLFIGHGEIVLYQKENHGALVFADQAGNAEHVNPYFVSDAIQGIDSLSLSMLLACDSAHASTDLHFQRSTAGVVLSETDIPYVLGAQMPINFDLSKVFLDGITESLAKGATLDLAISRGRKVMKMNVENDFSTDWWVPAFYTKTVCTFDVLDRTEDLSLESHL